MEAAPLSLAHSHARHAVLETQKANPIAASEEHDLAAGEFANATKGTVDAEALRILRLLEQHHLRLAEILKARPDDTQSAHSIKSGLQSPDAVSEPSNQASPLPPGQATAQQAQPLVSPTSPHLRRDGSSSLATNLASARGIPPARRRPESQSLAQVSPQMAEGRVVNPPRRSKLGEMESAPSDGDAVNPGTVGKDAAGHALPPPIATVNSEEPFSRFYSTFNNLISTLSAPLAFAGLPLNPAETIAAGTSIAPASTSQRKAQQPRQSRPASSASRATADPDLNRIFSRAALRAVREENGFGPVAESFYVVPTTGGTMSYAGMLSNARQASNLTDDDPDGEFVDARETPGHSPAQSRYARHRRAGSGAAEAGRKTAPPGANKTWEELAVENETLKNVVVDLGDRLRAFELGAQKSSLALHASMRQFSSPTASVVPGGKVPPMPGSAGGPLPLGAATKPLEDRIRELEDELKAVKKDNRRLGRENQKYLGVIEKYRERWEALKEGARERVKGGSSAGGGGGGAGSTGESAAKDKDDGSSKHGSDL